MAEPDRIGARRPPGSRRASREQRPTILYVDHAAALGGAEKSLLELLAHLDRSRYRPVLGCVAGELDRSARALDVPTRILPLPRLKGAAAAPWRLARGIFRLSAVVRSEQADIVHANVLRAAVYASGAGAWRHTPVVWHVRDIHAGARVARWLCRRSAAVIANSCATAAALPCGVRAHVIYNPVEPALSQRRSRAELLLPDGELVASIGILRPWKGHDRFLVAASRVRWPSARFLVIGGRIFGDEEPECEAELRALAARLGIAERVHFLGHRPDLADMWPHLAIVVHAAESEPFGRVVAESLLAGVPVVAFRSGGLPEIVDSQESGLLVPDADTGAMAEAIDRLLPDDALRRAYGTVGRERSRLRFDPDRHARSVEAVYEEILPGGAESAR